MPAPRPAYSASPVTSTFCKTQFMKLVPTILASIVFALCTAAPAHAGDTTPEPTDRSSDVTQQIVLQAATLKDLVEMETFLVRKKLAEAEITLRQVKERYSPNHPNVCIVTAKIEKLTMEVEAIKKSAAESHFIPEGK